MEHNYFYGQQAEEYTFYRIPKLLFTDPAYADISVEAKVLYGLMLDRMSLSRQNNWLDNYGRVYIMYSVDSICQSMSCARQKAYKLMAELEDINLIERIKLGQGRTGIIYVKSFINPEQTSGSTVRESSEKKPNVYENHTSDIKHNSLPDLPTDTVRQPAPPQNEPEPPVNKSPDAGEIANELVKELEARNLTVVSKASGKKSTYENHTPKSQTQPNNPPVSQSVRNKYREILEKNLEMDILRERVTDTNALNEIFELILDTVCTSKETIRVCGDEKPVETVKSRFLKLNSEHIFYVIDRLQKNTSEVRNPKQYLLAMLWNAPMSMGSHYTAMVNHDMNSF